MSLKGGIAGRFERMWWRKESPPALLRWISRLYAAVNSRNLKWRAKRAIKPAIPLISVGNITAGGSGKTPFVIWLCGELLQRGYKPVVLCRGDGGNLEQARRVEPGDAATEIGDEALLLARNCNVPVIAGRDRLAGCRIAEELGDIIILDDGFQYRQIGRQCDIVMLPVEGLGNGCLLPAGPLREPLSAVTRSDLIVRSGSGQPEPIALPDTGIREWRWQTETRPLRQILGASDSTPEQVLAVAGIARPERFIHTALQLVRVRRSMLFRDHHCFTADDVARMRNIGLPVLCTEKDAVKLLPLWPKNEPLWVLPIAGKGEQGLPEAIIGTMLSRLNQ